MRFNPFSRKKAVQLRTPDGKFAVAVPAASPQTVGPTVPKQLENEIKTFSLATEFMDGIERLVERRMSTLAPDDGSGSPSSLETGLEILDSIMPYVGPYIGPYIPGIMQKLGIEPASSAQTPTDQPTGGTQTPPPSAAPTPNTKGFDIKTLISLAAKSPPDLIKPFIPELNSELKKAGINEKEFKQAIRNINKAI